MNTFLKVYVLNFLNRNRLILSLAFIHNIHRTLLSNLPDAFVCFHGVSSIRTLTQFTHLSHSRKTKLNLHIVVYNQFKEHRNHGYNFILKPVGIKQA